MLAGERSAPRAPATTIARERPLLDIPMPAGGLVFACRHEIATAPYRGDQRYFRDGKPPGRRKVMSSGQPKAFPDRAPRAIALSAAALITLAGCGSSPPPPPPPQPVASAPPPTVVIVPQTPPDPRQEAIPPAPSAGAAWEAGHWRWTGTEWAWEPGHYVASPRAGSQWVAGYWAQQGNGWVWVPGHWM